jgi:hypothetical protein
MTMISLHQQSVNVNRVALLGALRKNREAHITAFQEAVDGYQEAMLETLRNTTKKVKRGEVKELNVRLPAPVSHEKDYTQVIEMLELSVDENINLSSDAFQAYFKDKWAWSEGFHALASSYSGKMKG